MNRISSVNATRQVITAPRIEASPVTIKPSLTELHKPETTFFQKTIGSIGTTIINLIELTMFLQNPAAYVSDTTLHQKS